MKLVPLQSNLHCFKISEDKKVFFSYQTPIAFTNGDTTYTVENQWSNTTARHINWIKTTSKHVVIMHKALLNLLEQEL